MPRNVDGFGIKKEAGILILTQQDADLKRKRNKEIAGKITGAVFSLGITADLAEDAIAIEKDIKRINSKHYPDLPYHKCHEMASKITRVWYNDREYRYPDPHPELTEQRYHQQTYDRGPYQAPTYDEIASSAGHRMSEDEYDWHRIRNGNHYQENA